MTEIVSEEFYGLLVPLADERLIVPRSCVAGRHATFTRPRSFLLPGQGGHQGGQGGLQGGR